MPAAPGLRVLAGIIDIAVLRVGSALPLLAVIQWNVPVTLFGMAAAHTILILCYFVLSETIWSASPGKLVSRVARHPSRSSASWCGTCLCPGRRLVHRGGTREPSPGWCSARAGLGTVTSGAGAVGYFAANAGTLAGFSLLFVTARRRNGFAGLHDLVTQTRVVSKLALAPRPSLQVTESRPPVASSATRIGPFVVLERCPRPVCWSDSIHGSLAGYGSGRRRRARQTCRRNAAASTGRPGFAGSQGAGKGMRAGMHTSPRPVRPSAPQADKVANGRPFAAGCTSSHKS